ncbi:MMPL family transporter [Geobacillus sp. MR]|uniref:MMPL family transporter n=1 Tax=Geobacillus sp. MR TaxID=2508875 RepID=UPI00148D2A86|nr:MMPL family transporter [Geobacillus sp. MR]NNU85932.1 MMPL family transporter [Geobacillus sp. MR]
MRAIIRGRWLVLLTWIAVAAVLVMTAPNMGELVREKGQLSVPDGYSSSVAAELIKEANKQENKENELSTVLVFYQKDGLTAEDKKEIERAVNALEKKKSDLHITNIISPFANPELEKELISKDKTTMLVSVSIDPDGRTAKQLTDALYEALDGVKVEHYFTGGWMIDEDVVTSSLEGVKKTEGITIVFILIVLLAVFRSPVAPLIPLVAVGATYAVSQSVVAFLVDKVDFPLSTFTQIFLVAVLFGIGTDYCILLLSRFKEELAKLGDRTEAIVVTYRTAGKTVLASGLAVMIGFASIGLSTFKLYQSAAAVAVGVAVLLVALVTLVPFFMAVLGEKLFWPVRGKLEHGQSRLWLAAGRFAFARPLLALIIVAAVTVPVLATYEGKLSFDSMEEIGDHYRSVKAFRIIADHFNPGDAMPTQIVLKGKQTLDSKEGLALIETISREVEKVNGVASVRSATRPTGEPIEQLLVTEQAKQLKDGLGAGKDGIEKIGAGLETASNKLSASAPQLKQASSGIGELVEGTEQLKNGIVELQNGLTQIEQGVRQGAMGAGELKKGVSTLRDNAKKLQAGANQLLSGYKQAEQGLSTISSQYQQVETGLKAVADQLAAVQMMLEQVEQSHAELRQDETYQRAKMTVAALSDQVKQMAAGLTQLNGALDQARAGLVKANESFAQLNNGQAAVNGGLDNVIAGLGELEDGLKKAADGQKQAVDKLPQFSAGLEQVNGGQRQLLEHFSALGGQLGQLVNGLDQSASGLRQVADGLGTAETYLADLSSAPVKEMAGWHMPKEALESKDFAQAKDAYMSKDGRIVTFDVILDENPYSISALGRIDDIRAAAERAVKGTKWEGVTIAIGGVTSTYADLRAISNADYQRTAVLMIIGIAIVLAVLLRSLIMPLYLMLSLVLTYFTSMAVTELIFVNGLGYAGLNWAVSFFAFVLLMALGIDYSIFLMDRFNEYRDRPVREAMLSAMGHMGTVIISAAVILGGTFAAMYPSGVLSLLQIATIVLTGLLLYALVVLPLFVPVMVRTFGRANWWPFRQPAGGAGELEQERMS